MNLLTGASLLALAKSILLLLLLLLLSYFESGGVRTGIAKHHEQYSNSDHLCQDSEE